MSAAGNLPDMTMMGPFLPYPVGKDEYRVAAADPGGEGAAAPAPGFGEAEGEPDIVDDTPEPGADDPVPERPAAEIPFLTPNPDEIGVSNSRQGPGG
ncbi:MAG: hypothetical protein M3300_05780 [Actinomycetota bacterium]|nr:hypothetical protein [Actinomycetota bacterium]